MNIYASNNSAYRCVEEGEQYLEQYLETILFKHHLTSLLKRDSYSE